MIKWNLHQVSFYQCSRLKVNLRLLKRFKKFYKNVIILSLNLHSLKGFSCILHINFIVISKVQEWLKRSISITLTLNSIIKMLWFSCVFSLMFVFVSFFFFYKENNFILTTMGIRTLGLNTDHLHDPEYIRKPSGILIFYFQSITTQSLILRIFTVLTWHIATSIWNKCWKLGLTGII